MKTFVFASATAVLAVGLPMLAAEGALRAMNRPAPVVSGWRSPRNAQLRLQLNQLGYRGQPIEYSPDDFVVVLVGDSQVEAVACSYDRMPERRLESYLASLGSVKVFSIGAGGYGQDQQLLALREYFSRFRADAVVVWETPGNDLWNNTFPTADPAGRQHKPTFWLEGNDLVGPSSVIGQTTSSPVRLLALARRVLASPDAAWEAAHLPPPYQPMRSASGPVHDVWQSLWDEDLGTMRTDDLASEKSHQAIYLTPRSPRTAYSVSLTHRLLTEMSALAHAHHASFETFWVDVPNVEVPEDGVYGLNGRYYRVSNGQRVANMQDVNEALDAVVEHVPSGDWRVSPTDGHLNEHAVDQVMAHLATALNVRRRLAAYRDAGPANRN